MSQYYAKFKENPCVGTDASTPFYGLEVKGLKQGHIFKFKIDPFISVLSYLIHFQAGLNIPRKNS